MSPDEPVPVEPEVLSDPADDDEPVDRKGGALVRSGERGLAPADPFRRYVAEIKKYPPLSREEEQELARRFRETGDREALVRLITSNLVLVVRIARSYRQAARNLLDLVQEGNVGLMHAIERFDPDVGVRLPTYAAWWVRAYMVKFLLDNIRLVRVGTTNARRKLLHNLQKEKAKLEAQGFEVGPRLLAERFGVSEDDVKDVQKALSSSDVSLDTPLGEDDGASHGDMLSDDAPTVEDDVARRELQEQVEEALDRFREDLNDRELDILNLRLLAEDPLTLQALGDRFGITREAARQAEGRLLKRLRAFLQEELGDVGQIRIGPS